MLQTPHSATTMLDVSASHITALHMSVISIAIKECRNANGRRSLLDRFNNLKKFLLLRPIWLNKSPLANSQLEALRQFVCFSRERDKRAIDLEQKLILSGFDAKDISIIASHALRP